MVRTLYGDSLAWSNVKKETRNDRPQDPRRHGLQVRLHHRSRLQLQPLRLQELQLLIQRAPGRSPGALSRAAELA